MAKEQEKKKKKGKPNNQYIETTTGHTCNNIFHSMELVANPRFNFFMYASFTMSTFPPPGHDFHIQGVTKP